MNTPALALSAISAAVLALSGCAAVRSSHVDFAGRSIPQGLHYSAPKALFRVELFDRDGELLLGVSKPFLVGDPEATYVLKASSSFLASQEYLYVVKPDTRLLTYINSVSEGEASKILENIARGFGGAAGVYSSESSRGGYRDLVIYSKIIDPMAIEGCDFGTVCTFGNLGAELRARALDYLVCDDIRSGFQSQICGRINANPNYFTLTLEPMFTAAAPGRSRNARPEDCNRSVCYRAPAPYRMGLRVAGVTDISDIVLLPNEAPVMSMSLPAGVFADASARVELYDGMPASYAVDRENEFLAITLLPISIIKGFFSAVSEVFQLRINLNSDRRDVLASETETDIAQAERRDFVDSRTYSDLIGDSPESSRTLSSESSRPMDDPRGGFTEGQGATIAGGEDEYAPLFEVPLTRRRTESAPAESGQDLAQ